MRTIRGPSRFWSFMFRSGLVKAHMPFWRVVVEARPHPQLRRGRNRFESAVTGVFAWARTIEEAEAVASLALAEEGFETITADAVKCAPSGPPSRLARAVARTPLGLLASDGEGAASRKDVRT